MVEIQYQEIVHEYCHLDEKKVETLLNGMVEGNLLHHRVLAEMIRLIPDEFQKKVPLKPAASRLKILQ